MSKNRRRREKQRQQKAQQQQPTGVPNDDAATQAAAQRRAQQKQEWAERRKARDKEPLPVALYAWAGSGVAVLVAVIVGAVLLLSGGGGSDGGPAATPFDDPRVRGLPVSQTVEIDADDDGQAINPRFTPNSITGTAGEVIEFKVKNIGSVAHNLRIAGKDHEYDDPPPSDDWVTFPATLQPGEEGSFKVKIDDPGTYEFRCDLHPIQQIGSLILS